MEVLRLRASVAMCVVSCAHDGEESPEYPEYPEYAKGLARMAAHPVRRMQPRLYHVLLVCP